MSRTVFPTTINGLAAYLYKVVAYLILEATRLGIIPERIDELKTLYGDDSHPGSYVYCKMQYDAASGRKDTIITKNLRTVSKNIKSKLRQIYNDIPATLWTDKDRETMNRKTGLPYTPTTPEVKIGADCNMEITAKVNGVFQFGVRPYSDSKRCNIAPGANGVELSYAYVQSNIRAVPIELASKVKVKCMGPEDDTMRFISTSSRFQINVDPIYAGFNLYCWARWINIQHPTLAGDWCPLQLLLIT
jgi:hypothetical protein